jgi:ABC-type antimicrobial peptide transport system permease subunit
MLLLMLRVMLLVGVIGGMVGLLVGLMMLLLMLMMMMGFVKVENGAVDLVQQMFPIVSRGIGDGGSVDEFFDADVLSDDFESLKDGVNGIGSVFVCSDQFVDPRAAPWIIREFYDDIFDVPLSGEITI